MKIFIIYLLINLMVSFELRAQSLYQETFNGPMPGWADVKKRFKAKADGKNDDTRALQTAIDSLTCRPMNFNTANNAYTVIYLPKGRYKISNTLVLKGKIGVQIIGEDPINTIIEWTGVDNDTMFWANGSSYFKVSRIQFYANYRKGIECLGIHWKDKWNDGKSRSFASLNIELSDLHFTGKPSIGISGGTLGGGGLNGTGNNDSEVTIKRNIFNDCSNAGIRITGYNALEYWIWDSKFLNCNIGVASSFGNYHAYRSYFRNSRVSDFYQKAGYYTSVRFCFSEDSKAFSIDEGSSSNPFKRVFQGNTVVNSKNINIEYYHVGGLTLLDNEIALHKDTANPFLVNQRSWAPVNIQLLSIGNSWGKTKKPVRIGSEPHRIFESNNRELIKYSRPSKDFLASMPLTPKFVRRKIYTVHKGATERHIQSLIHSAHRLRGQRPIIYFPYGEYILRSQLFVPAGADIQFTGDGLRYSTIIRSENPKSFKGRSLFFIQGPSQVNFTEIQFGTASKYSHTAIIFEKIDQARSEVRMDQIYSLADTTLFINQLNNAYFEKNNSFFSAGNVIIGGKNLQRGNGKMMVNCFGGQYAKLVVKNNARFVSKDCWYEGSTKMPLDIAGDGEITIDGAKIAPNPLDSQTIIRISRFNGKISLMNLYVQGSLELARDNPQAEILIWNANFYYKKNISGTIPLAFNGKLGFAGITTQCFYENDPYCKMIKSVENRFINVKNEDQFMETMTLQTRQAQPRPYKSISASESNIYFSRVSFDSYNVSLQFNE